ncbi:serine/threonine protein kinase [Ktedonospora formicarum]|uniref:non-specific serine/threonine protein kinase n=1 Tax=Ktedonospora formicarum TaxID=2778364 RepID=A0A8J3MU87_9CHLR|nr:serine/threonine-protein kinase [Ktedonospora formicarum]GHO46676.1 hypothetical protein KSX_48390 [Ktedonospora formicarum]
MDEYRVVRLHPKIFKERYDVEEVLGRGGFSTVYLVKDREGERQHFALKELLDQEPAEQARFKFEAELLMRLDHPALPSVYKQFEEGERSYMLMEYIDGPNLEVLRKQQTNRNFPLRETLTMLTPVADALTYLHTRTTPIIHRDIKPANIIVPKQGKTAVLVDFGIAKAYHPDATTTAIRRCTPGYGAPEQYSTEGSDRRTDIYGLAATCYTLLSGTVPIDAFQRVTQLATKKADPLQPLIELVPSLSPQVAQVIHRALELDGTQRYDSIEQFWQALQKAALGGSRTPSVVLVPTFAKINRQRQLSSLGRNVAMFSILLLVALVAVGSGIYFQYNGHSAAKMGATPTTPQHSIPTATQVSLYPQLAPTYDGTISNLQTNKTGSLQMTAIQQQGGEIKGIVLKEQEKGSFTGALDISRHILLTVTIPRADHPLFFQGSLRQDGNLVGSYCQIDEGGQCMGEYGIWSVSPGPSH